VNLISVNRTTLPAAMLDLAKSHIRVRHDRDDALITQYLAQAIEAVERSCSINLNPAVFALDIFRLVPPLVPGLYPCYGSSLPPMRLALPVNNVTAFTLDDADGVDQSADYTIEQADGGGSAASYLVGPRLQSTSGWTMTVDVGLEDPDGIAPAITAAVLRLTGGFYENRESSSALVVADFGAELMSIWRPTT
jgi:Phage gp6-like head-tail connector protein